MARVVFVHPVVGSVTFWSVCHSWGLPVIFRAAGAFGLGTFTIGLGATASIGWL
jgi:hypothetical protein